jgi:hypothetical protein
MNRPITALPTRSNGESANRRIRARRVVVRPGAPPTAAKGAAAGPPRPKSKLHGSLLVPCSIPHLLGARSRIRRRASPQTPHGARRRARSPCIFPADQGERFAPDCSLRHPTFERSLFTNQDHDLRLVSKVGLLQESGRPHWRPRTAECSHGTKSLRDSLVWGMAWVEHDRAPVRSS